MLVPLSIEAEGFLLMCIAGAASALVCQIIAIVTADIKKTNFAYALKVVLSGIAVTFILSFTALYYNGARLRYFMPIGALVGAILYIFAPGRIFGIIFKYIWGIFLKICRFIFKILLTPLAFFYKIIVNMLRNSGKMI